MKLALKQFRVLMWKCYIIRKRHWMTTLFEFIFSLLANILMVCVVNNINHKIHPSQSSTNTSFVKHVWINETIWPEPQYNLQGEI